ncbi:MAG TPA: hypothetical protein VH988_08815 [Thermoanaerobaculia bacterium]|jgi:hypothetical protein|nr:hypothetical protein [Thermoanaerobaculia bacterium]
MKPVKKALLEGGKPRNIADLLESADRQSFSIVSQVASKGELIAKSPSALDNVPACVCFSECTLPGLLGLCERYGRFGFVFEKSQLYSAGARPCVYLSRDEYHVVAKHGRSAPDDTAERRLFGLSNVYSPPGAGQVQDFTHDREWRLFQALRIADIVPIMYICPLQFVKEMRVHFGSEAIYIPIDLMFNWGA